MALSPKVSRLIDANLNRLKEGIRVVEDICRFIYDDKQTAYKLKNIRHNARIDSYREFLKHRDIIGDVLKSSTKSEQQREDIQSVILSNIKRAQESARVLEESFKLVNTLEAEQFKTIRYELYDIEKTLFQN
ncbi:MAG: thiamine-phosphate pyrophosphorylase [Campylobacterota bacterium]